jgi:hypothetical protein
MTRCAMLVVASLGAVSLGGCLTTTAAVPAWEHFDACSDQTAFHQWAMCGKANREAYCEARGNCSSATNAVLAYVDNLDQSVQRHELSETEARSRWIKFRNEQDAAREAARTKSDRTAMDKALAGTLRCGSAMSC